MLACRRPLLRRLLAADTMARLEVGGLPTAQGTGQLA